MSHNILAFIVYIKVDDMSKLILLYAMILVFTSASASATESNFCKYLRTIDGDTIEVMYKDEVERIRFYGVNAPERGAPGYLEAKSEVEKICSGDYMNLSFPLEKKRDNFGRLLAMVDVDPGKYLPNQFVININTYLFEKGLASKYLDSKNIIGYTQEELNNQIIDKLPFKYYPDQYVLKPLKNIPELINNGADVNITTPKLQTPLMLAVKNGNTDLIDLLLSNNANPNLKAKYGITAASIAIKEKKYLVLESFIRNTKLDLKNDYSSLFNAINNNSLYATTICVDSGIDLFKKDEFGKYAIKEAINNGDSHILLIKYILDKMNIPQQAYNKFVLFELRYFSSCSLETLSFFFDKGADVNAETEMIGGIMAQPLWFLFFQYDLDYPRSEQLKFYTPEEACSELESVPEKYFYLNKYIEIYVQNGFDVNGANSQGITTLGYIIENVKNDAVAISIIDALKKYKLIVNKKTNSLKYGLLQPYELANKCDRPRLASLLKPFDEMKPK